MSTPRATPPSTVRPNHPAASREATPGHVPVAKPAPDAQRVKPQAFADDPTRRPKGGVSFFKLQLVPRTSAGCEMRAYVATPSFAGKSVAVFRPSDLETFIDASRAFAERRTSVAALQGGVFSEERGLMQVLVGIHIYRPGDNFGCAAARIVVASPKSDDLLTATLQSAPLLIAQFADQMAAVAGGARDTALLIGQ